MRLPNILGRKRIGWCVAGAAAGGIVMCAMALVFLASAEMFVAIVRVGLALLGLDIRISLEPWGTVFFASFVIGGVIFGAATVWWITGSRFRKYETPPTPKHLAP
jgi:hypothetical protein